MKSLNTNQLPKVIVPGSAETPKTTFPNYQVQKQYEAEYIHFLHLIQQQVNSLTQPLFTTDYTGNDVLYDTYLRALPTALRQHYNCNECRRFMRKYGGLVKIDEQGRLSSAIYTFNDVKLGHQLPAVKAVVEKLTKAVVEGSFYTPYQQWGVAKSNGWSHQAGSIKNLRTKPFYAVSTELANKKSGLDRSGFESLSLAVKQYDTGVLTRALQLIRTGKVSRAEKIEDRILWFLNVKEAVTSGSRARRDNLLWKAVVGAPAGFATIRGGIVGAFLDDLLVQSDDQAARNFNQRVDPLFYQRSQAAPKAGAIKQADRFFQENNLEASLRRRYASYSEVPKVWVSSVSAKAQQANQQVVSPFFTQTFGALSAKQQGKGNLPAGRNMSFAKFLREVLPKARAAWLLTPEGGTYGAYTTAQNAKSKKIFLWDNHFSFFQYVDENLAVNWSLQPNKLVLIRAISYMPYMFNDPNNIPPTERPGACLLLEGARDRRVAPMCIFPEHLKGELKEHRATINTFSNTNPLGPVKGRLTQAAGWFLTEGMKRPVTIQVFDGRIHTNYVIDRWD